jgi:hypothetical protein
MEPPFGAALQTHMVPDCEGVARWRIVGAPRAKQTATVGPVPVVISSNG